MNWEEEKRKKVANKRSGGENGIKFNLPLA